MEFTELYNKLELLGTAQNRKVYKKHGASDNMFGVSMANLKLLKKQIKINHELAVQLWATQNMDAQSLATYIANPKEITKETAKEWASASTYYNLSDLLVSNLLFKTPFAKTLMEEFIRTEKEYVQRAGWKILALFALKNKNLSDAYFKLYLTYIEQNIHQSKNRTKEAMNSALIAIGCRNQNLEEMALLIAERIGEIEVDHGDTSCKTPNASKYILKVKQRNLSKKDSRLT